MFTKMAHDMRRNPRMFWILGKYLEQETPGRVRICVLLPQRQSDPSPLFPFRFIPIISGNGTKLLVGL
jgi:hypothetical protein